MDTETFNLDLHRENRIGFPEVVFGANKDIDSLLGIIGAHKRDNRDCLVTRLSRDRFTRVDEAFPGGFYDPVSGVWMLDGEPRPMLEGSVGIVSAGTSDAFVVNEAYYTLRYLGAQAERFQDVGVAGIHRVFKALDKIDSHDVLIVVAGFEGALPTVIGGLLRQPVIAVPTSVGYGVAEGGRTALNAILSSCANGISVVNIDNGYGAAMCAFRILNTLRAHTNRFSLRPANDEPAQD